MGEHSEMDGRTLAEGTEEWMPVHAAAGHVEEAQAARASAERLAAELHETRGKLVAALEAMSDAVFISDEEGRFIEFNEAFATYHRFKNKAECYKRLDEYPQILDVYLPSGELATLDQWAVPRALRGESATAAEYRLHRKDTGDTWWGSYNFAPIRDGRGNIVGSVVTGRDITEQRAAREEVRRLNEELEQQVAARTAELTAANRDLDAYAFAVSHELKSPLRTMCGFSKLLLERHAEGLPPEAMELLHGINDAGLNMTGLIEGLLGMSRSTRQALKRARVDLSNVATEQLRKLAGEEPERAVDWRVAPGLEVEGDLHLLEVVLANLLGNAWKYTRNTAAPMIRVNASEQGGKRWICVVDNGAGFDMRYGRRLFEPFQRLHRQDEFPGVGVGLATVQRIIERHGGKVAASGAPNQGATFRFTTA